MCFGYKRVYMMWDTIIIKAAHTTVGVVQTGTDPDFYLGKICQSGSIPQNCFLPLQQQQNYAMLSGLQLKNKLAKQCSIHIYYEKKVRY